MGMNRGKVRIALVEDSGSLAESYQFALEAMPEIEFLGVAQNFDDALALIQEKQPDVALIDLRLGEGANNGVELIRRIKLLRLPTKTLVISSFVGDKIGGQAVLAGADGMLSRSPRLGTIVKAIHLVHAGIIVLGPEEELGDWFGGIRVREEFGDCPLRERQREVLELIAQGLSNADIGRRLHLAEGTVRSHVSNILRSLDVGSREEAVAKAREAGWIR